MIDSGSAIEQVMLGLFPDEKAQTDIKDGLYAYQYVDEQKEPFNK